jgi:phosphatidylinositol glycan class H protein
MLTTLPHLYIRRPSPTTAEYTVTTRPPPSLALRLALVSLTTLRLVLFLVTLLLLTTHLSLLPHPVTQHPYLRPLLASPPYQALVRLTGPPLPAWAFATAACAVLYVCFAWQLHTTERLLVLRGLGIQTSTTGEGVWGSWRPATRFIPTEKIRDVLINEAFRGFEVRYYLVVLVEGEEEVVVVFPRLLPRRRIVEAVWRGVRGCLYEQGGEGRGEKG